jgi:hypothetical protein
VSELVPNQDANSLKAQRRARVWKFLDLAAKVTAFGTDRYLELKGSPVTGVLDAYEIGKSVVQENILESEPAFAEALRECEKQLEDLKSQVEGNEAATERLDSRFTLTFKAIMQAGLNPYKAVRDAHMRFAGRVLVSKADEVALFEIADALGRLTSHDYEYLKILAHYQQAGQSLCLVMDGKHSIDFSRGPVGSGSVQSPVIALLMERRIPGFNRVSVVGGDGEINLDRVSAIEHRLSVLRLIHDINKPNRERIQSGRFSSELPDYECWNVTDLGLELLRLSALPVADLPTGPAE